MNLELLKQSEKKVKTSEKFPSIPVMTIMSDSTNENKEKSVKMIKFNVNSLNTLNVGGIGREDYNRIIVFEEYLISDENEPDRYDIAMFVTNEKQIKANKIFKSYEIALGTRKCMSSEIYDIIVDRFNLDTTKDNYFQLVETPERTGGAFSLKLIIENETEILFDKGENVEVEMHQY